jgi:hypothetical protein
MIVRLSHKTEQQIADNLVPTHRAVIQVDTNPRATICIMRTDLGGQPHHS